MSQRRGRIAQGAGIDVAAPGDCSSERRLSEVAGVDAIHAGRWRLFCRGVPFYLLAVFAGTRSAYPRRHSQAGLT